MICEAQAIKFLNELDYVHRGSISENNSPVNDIANAVDESATCDNTNT